MNLKSIACGFIVLMAFNLPLIYGGDSEFDPKAAVNKDIVRKIDVTGDGELDTISLNIRGKNFFAPFNWTLTIISKGKQIYRSKHDDASIDKFFNDKGYVNGCVGYLTCKAKWYFHDILDSIIVPQKGYDLEGILDRSQKNTLYAVGSKYLESHYNIRGSKANNILVNIERRLRTGKAVVVAFPKTPANFSSIMVFVPEIDCFMPIYED
jgi:hypothetical protein